MVDPSRTVFLSYRREVSWALAHAVRADLVQHGFDVFMDVESMDNGEFGPRILGQIEARTHFVLLLEPGSLDRLAHPGDWLRREIAHALTHRRNVVPVLAGRAEPPHAADLPADVARLAGYNAVTVPPDYFADAMQKLRDRFLRQPVDRVSTPDVRPDIRSVLGRWAGRPGERPEPRAPRARIRNGVLSWTAVPGTRLYLVETAHDGAFHVPCAVYLGTERECPVKPGPTTWWYRVKACGGPGAHSWSKPVALRPRGRS